MIVAFSTSSPVVSVAALGDDGVVLGELSSPAPRTASGVCIELLQQLLGSLGSGLGEARGFVADVGPGSFTGIRVGVTLAKCLAFAAGVKTRAAHSFDLVRHDATVAIPAKRDEYYVRVPGRPLIRVTELPPGDIFGYGPAFEAPIYPKASNVSHTLAFLKEVEAEALLPYYASEPSISQPRRPFRQVPSDG